MQHEVHGAGPSRRIGGSRCSSVTKQSEVHGALCHEAESVHGAVPSRGRTTQKEGQGAVPSRFRKEFTMQFRHKAECPQDKGRMRRRKEEEDEEEEGGRRRGALKSPSGTMSSIIKLIDQAPECSPETLNNTT